MRGQQRTQFHRITITAIHYFHSAIPSYCSATSRIYSLALPFRPWTRIRRRLMICDLRVITNCV